MSGPVRAVGGALLIVAAVLILGALSRVPYAAEPATAGVVRLAWRTLGDRVRDCRRLTPEELARLPAHMREEEVCEGRILPYRLTVLLDGNLAADLLVHAAGAREDRPLYVYQQFPLGPGKHRLQVDFERQGSPGQEPREEAFEGDREHAQVRPGPARLALDTAVILGSREILLVTYDADARRLVIRKASVAPSS